jgi:hypothetical protein
MNELNNVLPNVYTVSNNIAIELISTDYRLYSKSSLTDSKSGVQSKLSLSVNAVLE